MAADPRIGAVARHFSKIYLGGIPQLLNDDGAFLSFICMLTAIEALGGFLNPKEANGPRFKKFVGRYFPPPYPTQADDLWKLRNAAVHGFSPGPYALMHHQSHAHLGKTSDGRTMLNAEDLYAVLVQAAAGYFSDVGKDAALQAAFTMRADDPDTGVLTVAAIVGGSP